MDFTQRQDEARAASRRLTLLFLLALALVVAAINLAGATVWRLSMANLPLPPYFVLTNSLVVLLFVIGGGWLESSRLREGGGVLARRLGARPLDTARLSHQRLGNVVAELAIAAGIPVPEAFVLDDPSINALTAGDEPARCAIVLTQGALDRLDRAELQGVVAHEIAHVLNGDMALNTRAAGAVFGLMSLSLMGRSMLGGSFLAPDPARRERPGPLPLPVFWLAGLALLLVGWIGYLAGRLLQAGLSRQREFLADALAVELTRQTTGLGRALRKIAGQGRKTQQHPQAEYMAVVAHLLLVAPPRDRRWLDSHPPLAQRIRRLYGRYMPSIESTPADRQAYSVGTAAALLAPLEFERRATSESTAFARSGRLAQLAQGARSGSPNTGVTRRDRDTHAEFLLAAVRRYSPPLGEASRLLCGLVAPHAAAAASGLAPAPAPADDDLVAALAWVAQPQGSWLRLPLLEVLTARLRPWPLELRMRLLEECRAAVLADGRIEQTEWVYFTLVRHRLLPRSPVGEPSADDLRNALAEVFGLAATLSRPSARATREAVSQAARVLDIAPPVSTSEQAEACTLTRALEHLASIGPLQKPGIMKVLGELAGDTDDPCFEAFLAAVAAAIDCPPVRYRARRKHEGAGVLGVPGA